MTSWSQNFSHSSVHKPLLKVFHVLTTILTLGELSSNNVKYYFLWGSWFTERTNYECHAKLSWSLFDMQNDEKWGKAAEVQRVTSGHKGDLTAGAMQKLSSKNSGFASRDPGGTPAGNSLCKVGGGSGLVEWSWRWAVEGRPFCNRASNWENLDISFIPPFLKCT